LRPERFSGKKGGKRGRSLFRVLFYCLLGKKRGVFPPFRGKENEDAFLSGVEKERSTSPKVSTPGARRKKKREGLGGAFFRYLFAYSGKERGKKVSGLPTQWVNGERKKGERVLFGRKRPVVPRARKGRDHTPYYGVVKKTILPPSPSLSGKGKEKTHPSRGGPFRFFVRGKNPSSG